MRVRTLTIVGLVHGDGGGTGLGIFTAYTEVAAQDPDILQKCLTGSLVYWRFEWAVDTVTPLAS